MEFKLPVRAQNEEAAHAQENDDILATAELHFRQGRNHLGLALLDRLTELSTDQRRLAIRLGVSALVRERRFEEAISLFESSETRMTEDARAFPSYIEACVSSGDLAKARESLKSVIFRTGKSAPKLLALLYRFSSLLELPHRSLFAERLLAVAGQLRPFSRSLMHLGHNLTKQEDWREFFEIIRVLESFDLKMPERASVSLLLAQLAHQVGDTTAFVERLNEALRLFKATPVSLIDDNLSFELGNVVAPVTRYVSDGPLVSVIMTAYNAEASIDYAIASVLAQSYRNLELIVVDDHSGDKTTEIIRNIAAKDRRIVTLFAPKNIGTYSCKNLALLRVQGEFVTCHDSDDWAHPHRIETAVSRLAKSPSLVATSTQVVRFSSLEGLQFRRDYIQPDAPSLTYRADPVRRSLGFYDSVRASGDIEFEMRMRRAFGVDAVHRGEGLLTLASWSNTTLTGGGPFAISNDTALQGALRDQYRREFAHWHEHSSEFYVDFPLRKRPFPAPKDLLSAHFPF